MPEPPRRKRFQIHLSTALIMMLAAGGLIWANVVPRRAFSEKVEPVIPGIDMKTNEEIAEYGWPNRFLTCFSWTLQSTGESSGSSSYYSKFHSPAIAINSAVALVILLAIRFTCELWIRRREASAKMRDER